MNQRDLIASRETPMVLSRSEDPTRRMGEDMLFDGNPLRHRTAIYEKGIQAEFRPVYQNIGFGLKRRIG